MTEHDCHLTDGHQTITRDDVTPQQLFDLAHDMLDRLDGLEWAFMCAVLIQLRQLEVVTDPGKPTVQHTLELLQQWLDQYQRDQLRTDRDREFMGSPE